MPHCGEEYFIKRAEEGNDIDDIKTFLHHIKAHEQVIENLEYNLLDTEENREVIKVVNEVKNIYQKDFEITVEKYIDDAIENIFIKMSNDFELVEGGLEMGSEQDIKAFRKTIMDWIKVNFKGLI